jgi:hypothetical protein
VCQGHRLRPRHFDHAETGAAQGWVYADNDLRSARRRAEAAFKNGLGNAPCTAQARFELLELPGCDRHGGRWRGIKFSLFKPELKTKSPPLANSISSCDDKKLRPAGPRDLFHLFARACNHLDFRAICPEHD